MFICFHVFVGWVVWYSGLLWLVIFVVMSRCDLMCKLIRLHTRGCVGSQIRLVACLSNYIPLYAILTLFKPQRSVVNHIEKLSYGCRC